jgi:hypothetical protein
MSPPADLDAALARLRARRRAYLATLGAATGVAVAGVLVDAARTPLFGLALLVWLAGLPLYRAVATAPCPRCARRFNEAAGWFAQLLGLGQSWRVWRPALVPRRRCGHCGLGLRG